MSEQTLKGKFGMAFVLSIIASVMIMVSPSLVWFREEMEVFGQSFGGLSVKGSELGDLAELASWTGISIFARGEYAMILGAFALVLTVLCFFVPSKRKLMASLVGIIAVLCLGVGLEPTLKLIGEGTMPGEGVYLLLVGSMVLLIGAFRLPSSVTVEAPLKEATSPLVQSSRAIQEPVSPEVPKIEPKSATVPPAPESVVSSGQGQVIMRPSGRMPEPAVGMDSVMVDRNRVIAVAIGLILLAIFSSFAFRLPEASTRIIEGLFVGSIIKILVAVIMLVMLLSVRAQLMRVIAYYARGIFKLDRYSSQASVLDKINGLSAELCNVVVVVIAWPLVVEIVKRLIAIDMQQNLGWISIFVTLAFVGLLLYRLYRGYQMLEPVLAVVGKGRQEVFCPKCGTMNLVGAKFCSSCGADLQPVLVQKATSTFVHCPKCGAENGNSARFCQNCGVSLAKN